MSELLMRPRRLQTPKHINTRELCVLRRLRTCEMTRRPRLNNRSTSIDVAVNPAKSVTKFIEKQLETYLELPGNREPCEKGEDMSRVAHTTMILGP